MHSHLSRRSLIRGITAATAVASLAGGLAACGGDSDAATTTDSAGTVTVGRVSNGAAQQTTLKVAEVESLKAELPAAVRKRGTLKIVVGALPDGFPPLAYIGGDQKTLTGAEPDFGRLVAAVLGLRPQLSNATWENMFVGIDSGKADVGFANITDTEERKKKYDFASYRKDNVGFEVLKKSTWNFDGDYENLAGKTVAVDNGTNQEKILLEWQTKLKREGKNLTVKHYASKNATYLALTGGRIDAYFAANPGVAYHVTQTAKSPNPTRSAGTFSGAGARLQGLIAATTKKDSGLAKPIADAINYLIKNGQYAEWLKAYNLSNEAVAKSEVNPPGLPLSNS
ncbi:amino acid ABC transporter substrate-binding protein (PAAT family) [Streptomyces puniciscabiei]|uniref:Amino acid ABC transporter substrate-binding protein (PAAT family) n=1 Tax=Streptomyces puniciscabiei TaxID=164348 RepID=A0A542SZU6_9ACTN|nr:transporter substrate-binding domain-containing protein [Streptomyces puniciscabiei]TQK80131.1 amino acid ABC transporter substrate-binding protein (PAAT family) [Streptomyces puniciscabiei]